MPRIRTIKPEFWSDEKLSPLPDSTRLLFLGLIGMADDFGRLVDSPKQIEAFVWPHEDRSRDCREGLATLSGRGRIRRGLTRSGQSVIQITHWPRHQKVDKPSVKGALPEIVEAHDDARSREPVASDSRATRESAATLSRSDLDLDLDLDLGPRTYDQEQERADSRGAREAGERTPSELTTAQRLVIAANQAIAKKFGEQTRPLLPGHSKTVELATWVDAACVPIDIAERSIARQGTNLASPIRTMAYFRLGILEDWESHQANAAAVAAPRILPLEHKRHGRPESRVPLRGGSPPAPDDGVLCRTCGTTETHTVNRRLMPKHLESCALAAATAQIGAGPREREALQVGA